LIDPDKKQALETLCAQQDLTPSQVVRQLIREYLAKHGVRSCCAHSVSSACFLSGSINTVRRAVLDSMTRNVTGCACHYHAAALREARPQSLAPS
jgi:hypothetical protein